MINFVSMIQFNKIFLVFLILFAVDVAFGQGCSQCKLIAEQGADLEEASFGSSINTGILYLMAVPYILLLIVFHKKIFTFFKSLKRG